MLKKLFGSQVDIGRLIVTPLFTVLLVRNLYGLLREVRAIETLNPAGITALINQALVLCFYILVVFLYFVRTSARSTTASLAAKIAALAASFLPFLLPFLRGPEQDIRILTAAGAITVTGMVIALSALSSLGKSFSIIPQSRSLVQTGPYRYIRHPLYAGELISLAGVVLAGWSFAAAVVFCLIAILQGYRALEEERILGDTFPEYESYSLNKARFIPRIF